MTYVGYDAVTASNMPHDGDIYFYYANGTYANESAVKSHVPGKFYVPIDVRGTLTPVKGMMLDVEPGDVSPSGAVAWCTRYSGSNKDLVIYCNTSQWPSVRAAFKSAGVEEPSYEVAQYDGNPSIPAPAIAKQYLGDYNGYDKVAIASWPGFHEAPVPPKPPVQEDTEMIIVHASGQSAQYLLFSTGKLHHIVDPASLASYTAAGLKTAVISAADLAALLSAK